MDAGISSLVFRTKKKLQFIVYRPTGYFIIVFCLFRKLTNRSTARQRQKKTYLGECNVRIVQQNNVDPTPVLGNTLDLVIYNSENSTAVSVNVEPQSRS